MAWNCFLYFPYRLQPSATYLLDTRYNFKHSYFCSYTNGIRSIFRSTKTSHFPEWQSISFCKCFIGIERTCVLLPLAAVPGSQIRAAYFLFCPHLPMIAVRYFAKMYIYSYQISPSSCASTAFVDSEASEAAQPPHLKWCIG
jgi:hypothetical protein